MDKRLGVRPRTPSPRYLEKVCMSTIAGSFVKATQLLESMSGIKVSAKTVQRQSEAMGELIRQEEDEWIESYRNGAVSPKPQEPSRAPLLVITTDGGRVQTRQAGAAGKWKENKVGVVYRAVPTPEKAGEKYHGPSPLERTYVATMRNWDEMTDLLSAEAEGRGWRHADEVVLIGDGAAGVKGLWQIAFATAPFILDWAHAAEHVHDCAKAAFSNESKRISWAKEQKTALWEGRVGDVQQEIVRLLKKVGDPPQGAVETDPRVILKRNVGYFRENAPHMDYPTYRKKGWPIGSGIVESAVKQVGKRMKGTEKFWSMAGAESTMALIGYFLSEDGRWNRFWNHDVLQLSKAA